MPPIDKTLAATTILALASTSAAFSQGRPLDWPFYGGDAQRTGWEKSDFRITRDNVKDFVLVLKRKLENKGRGPRSLTPPVVIGNLISYRGFKELAFVSGSSGTIWSIDADMDRVFWEKQVDESPGPSKANGGLPYCSDGVVATPSLTPPTNFGAGRGARPVAPASPGAPPTPAASTAPVASAPTGRSILGAGAGGGGFGSPRPAYVLSRDGKLHLLNTSNGNEVATPVQFIPANAKASSLTISDGVIYTTTSGSCGGTPDGVWALDLSDPEKISKFLVGGAAISSLGGLAIAPGGGVFVQTGSGAFDPDGGKWGSTLLSMNSRDLQLQHYFVSDAKGTTKKTVPVSTPTTPVLFTYKEHELIVSATSDGRLALLDAKSVGGDDHKTALYQTAPLVGAGSEIWGGLSSWQDPDGTRWVLAPVWGALSSEFGATTANGAAPNGSIVAFKMADKGGKPELTLGWISRNMSAPEPPVITSGVVFALAAGDYGRDERPKGSSHATLYAFDGITGKEIYNTGNQVSAPANLTGMTIANARVYFTTTDNTLYAFGIFLER